MSHPKRLAFVGNSLPRRCGIATFTTDLHHAVRDRDSGFVSSIVAMNDHGRVYDYPSEVGLQIRDDVIDDYLVAARMLNDKRVDIVSLQHEFGIYGGEGGSHILRLLAHLEMPVITTLHTILPRPSAIQSDVIERIVAASYKVVAMSEKGRTLLETVYSVPAHKIEVIPHGIPDRPFVDPREPKARLGFSGRSVILTFGLLSPNKGIEVMINAMPAIVGDCPDAIYIVLGATHPNLVLQHGEAYREHLATTVRDLELEKHVVFIDQFVDLPQLLEYIEMCDVYVTPYLDAAQLTSGTLAYSYGLGRAIVSTPYWHARELLANGRGVLVPFGDSAALAREITLLLTDDEGRDGLRERAYAGSRSMTWARTADRYIGLFEDAMREQRLKAAVRASLVHRQTRPEMQTGYFLSMCDDTGILQHAIHSIPDRSHGYCVDDNARALLLTSALNAPGEEPLPDIHATRLAAFVQHAWNPDNGRFRNFMSFSREWLEDMGSEDSHGRSLWALGECARSDASPSRRLWAATLFPKACAVVPTFTSPRAWAFSLLGLDGYCAAVPGDFDAENLRRDLADRLISLLAAVETSDWIWFEEGLSYDNARLPQALLVTGTATAVPRYVSAGLRTLKWLMKVQTSSKGGFRPVGTAGFGDKRSHARPFDQQPLDAAASIAACRAAWLASHDPVWRTEADRAFDWFLGANDLGACLVDVETGSCRDGLHPDRPNENRGAESVLSWLLGLADIRGLDRAAETVATAGLAATVGRRSNASAPIPNRGQLGTHYLPEPTSSASPPRPNAGHRPSLQARD